MATKKAPTKKASSASKTTVRTVKATEAKPVAAPRNKPVKRGVEGNVLNIVLAELVGTFVLTMVALMTATETVALYVGLALMLLVMSIGAISGSHVNPAVTFGLWVAGKVKVAMVPFYWGAQFLGAMAAFLLVNSAAGSKLGMSFAHFGEFSWMVFFAEFVGTAVFLFGLVSVLRRADLSSGGKAVGVGLSLMIAIVVAGSLYTPAREAAIRNYQAEAGNMTGTEQPAVPHVLAVKGATLNPAVALAATEAPVSENTDTQYSRLSLEVIAATLSGAALGALVARLLAYRFSS